MWEKQISISFIQILAWISMRFSRKLHYYCEERSMLMLCHCIYLQSLLHSAWRNNSPQIMTFCSHSSFAHILRSPCSCSTRDQKQKTSRPEEGKECLLTGLVCTHSFPCSWSFDCPFLCYINKAKEKPTWKTLWQHNQLLTGFRPFKSLQGAFQYQTRTDQVTKYEECPKILIWETKEPPGVMSMDWRC